MEIPKWSLIAVILVLALFGCLTTSAAETVSYRWDHQSEDGTVIDGRADTCDWGCDYYLGDLRCYVHPEGGRTRCEGDFMACAVFGLSHGDGLAISGNMHKWRGYGAIRGYWTRGGYSWENIVSNAFDLGPIGDFSETLTVPDGVDGFIYVLSAWAISDTGAVIIPWVELAVPDHAYVVLPSGVVGREEVNWGTIKAMYR